MSGALVVLGGLNARVGNEVIKGIVGRHGVTGRNESGERLLEKCAVENGGRKGGRQSTIGLCVVTKTNAWKTVRCESVERRRGGLLTIFW